MNEEVLLKLYDKYDLSTVGDFEQFKSAMSTPEGQKLVYDKYLSKVGTFDQFQQAIGSTQPSQVAPEQSESKVGKFFKSLPGLVSRGATEFVPSVMEVAGAGEALIGSGLRKLGVNEGEPLIPQAAQKTREFIEEGTYVDPEIEQSTAGQVASGVGQLIPFVATAGLSGGAQLGARTPQVMGIGKQAVETVKAIGKQAASPAGVIGGSMVAGPEWRAAKEAGLSDEEAFSTMVQNYFVGQTEIIPIHNALKVLDKVSGGKLVSALKSVGTGGFQEAVQEAFQTYLTNEIAKGSYDPDRDPMFQVLESAKVGGLVGMLIPAVGSVVPRSKQVQEKLDKKVVELQINEEISKSDTGNPEINEGIDNQTKDVTDAIQENTSSKEGTQEGTSEEEKVTKQVSEPVTDQTVADEQVTDQPTKSVTELVTEFNESGTLLGQAEDTAEGKRSALSENVADFLRSKGVTEQSQIDEFVTELNSKSVEGQPIIKPADVNRISSLLQTPKPKPFDGETVVRKVNDEIKRITAEFAKGKTQGVREGVTLMREQINKVRQVLKDANLSRQQTRAILRKLNSTSFFTPGSISSLNDFISKVVSDAEYATKVSKAQASKVKINRNAPKTMTSKDKEAIGSFMTLDPTSVEDIDSYLDKADQILTSYKPATKGFKAAPHSEIKDFVRKETLAEYKKVFGENAPDSMSTAKMREKLIEKTLKDRQEGRIESLLGQDFDEEELMIMLADENSVIEGLEEQSKIEQARKQLRVLAEEAKNSLPKTLPNISKVNQKELDALHDLDLDMLDADQLKFFIKATDNIAVNGDFGYVGNLEAEAMAQKNFKKLISELKGSTLGKIFLVDKWITSLPMLSKAMFGLSTQAAKFQLYLGIKGVANARVESFNHRDAFVSLLNTLSKSHPKAFTDEGTLRVGMLSTLVEYVEDGDVDEKTKKQALEENKAIIEEDLATYQSIGDSESKKLLEDSYKPYKDADTIEKVFEIASKRNPEELAVLKELIKFHEQYSEQVEDYNRKYFNEKVPRIKNYTGERQRYSVEGAQKGIIDSAQDTLRKPKYMGDIAGMPKRFTSAHKRSHRANRDANNKVLKSSDGKVINFNKYAIGVSQIQKQVFEMNAMPHMIAVRNNANRRDANGISIISKEIFGWREGDSKKAKRARERADYMWDALFSEKDGKYFTYEDSALGRVDITVKDWDKWAGNISRPLRHWGYALSLGGPSQAIKQSTVLINSHLQLGEHAYLIPYADYISDHENFKAFMKSETVGHRKDMMSVWDLGEVVSQAQISDIKKQYKNFIKSKGKSFAHQSSGWASGIEFLTRFDANAAELSYGGFYKQYLLQNGASFRGWKEELNRKDDVVRQEARAYAKQRVDELQVPSDPAEQAAFMKSQKAGDTVLRVFMFPFGTFNNNAKTRLWHAWKFITYGNKQQKKTAAAEIAGTTAESFAFTKISTMIKASLYAPLFSYVMSLFGAGDAEEDEEMKLERKKRIIEKERTMLTMDALPVILTDPGQDILIQGINEAYMTWYKPDEMSRGEFEKEHGQLFRGSSANFRDDGAWNTFLETMGVYGVPVKRGTGVVKSFYDVTTNAKKEYPLTDDQLDYSIFALGLEAMNLGMMAPSDLMFASKSELEKQKKIQRKYGRRNYNYPNAIQR